MHGWEKESGQASMCVPALVLRSSWPLTWVIFSLLALGFRGASVSRGGVFLRGYPQLIVEGMWCQIWLGEKSDESSRLSAGGKFQLACPYWGRMA